MTLTTTPQKILIVADSHGDMIDDRTRQAVLSFKRSYKPDIIIHLGDAWDFRPLRRGASIEEKSESMMDDYAHGETFLKALFSGDQNNYFLMGNHDDRIYDYRDKN